MRICLMYDCLFPHTVGGAERWYRSVAERLAAEGHEVTYLTLRQWPKGTDPGVPGVRVVAVGPQMALYGKGGARRVLPPLVFGLGVFAHLARHRHSYDVVHTASFPFFSLLAAAALRRVSSYRVVVDWFEVWTLGYWQEYLGSLGGRVGWAVQRACTRVRQQAFCFSRLHAARLRSEGLRGPVTMLAGIYDGSHDRREPEPADGAIVFAGRHIPEKRVPLLVEAMAHVHRQHPQLRCDIFGDGPDRPHVEAAVRRHELTDTVRVHGFVESELVQDALARATAMALPSRREGYGLVVVESAARGTPSVVVAGPDNAATELIEEGVNGTIAPRAEPESLAAAIDEACESGPELRQRTADWFARNADRLSLERSLETVVAVYEDSSR